MAHHDVYISADIEADGPIPGRYSMLSFGLVVAANFDGKTFAPSADGETFYRELKPIAEDYLPEAVLASGLDRDQLARTGAEPAEALSTAAEWVESVAEGARPVLVGYPVVFDWMFLHWYFVAFCGE